MPAFRRLLELQHANHPMILESGRSEGGPLRHTCMPSLIRDTRIIAHTALHCADTLRTGLAGVRDTARCWQASAVPVAVAVAVMLASVDLVCEDHRTDPDFFRGCISEHKTRKLASMRYLVVVPMLQITNVPQASNTSKALAAAYVPWNRCCNVGMEMLPLPKYG